eukprot:gi/632951088/ref/XP_007891101.1/ PREDICTED: scavenger receptor class A member 3 isoform X2 [Callorhinchus milii]
MKEDDFMGEEEEMHSFRCEQTERTSRHGCCRCHNASSLNLAVKMLYIFFSCLIIAVAVLATVVFRKVDSISENITVTQSNYETKISSVQTNIKELDQRSLSKNCSLCRDVHHFGQEVAELQKEFEQIQQLILAQEPILDETLQNHVTLSMDNKKINKEVTNYSTSVKQINQTLENFSIQIDGLQALVKDLDTFLRRLAQDQYEIRIGMQQINFTTKQNSLWLEEIQRKTDEETLILQKVTTDWLNSTRVFGVIKASVSKTNNMVKKIQSSVAYTLQKISQNSEAMHDLSLQILTVHEQFENISTFLDDHEENIQDILYHAKYYENRTAERLETINRRMVSHETEISTILANINATNSHVHSMINYISDVRGSCSNGLSAHSDELYYLNNSLMLMQSTAESLRQRYNLLSTTLTDEVSKLGVVMEEMKIIDVKHADTIKNFTIMKGIPGPPGLKGNKGETGIRGATGLIGIKGDTGDPGPSGKQGPRGLDGVPGYRGEKGSKGPIGSSGPKGEKGSLGRPGLRGEIGPKGDRGPLGPEGKSGSPGARGPTGMPGAPGHQGSAGLKGEMGPRGPHGPPGPSGLLTDAL